MQDNQNNDQDNFHDVVIIGAGISGINAAYRLQCRLPDYSYTILEARDSLGGTWDLFNYPGIRSDSDLHTFGFPWQPWPKDNDIADGPSIKKYMHDTAAKHGIDRHIQFQKRVTSCDWSSKQQLWRLTIEVHGRTEIQHGRFLIIGTGYYDYKNPLPAIIPGIENFKGKVVHPQFWPEDLDYADKKVIIIGSGATAVTLLPNLAEKAKVVTMLQRSPSYVASRPMSDPMVNLAKRWLPSGLALSFARWKNLLFGYALVWWCRAFPQAARRMLKSVTVKQLPKTIPHNPNFEPSYNPWEQRLCLCPDGDFFEALRKGKGDVVTGHIKTMTANTIVLESGQELDADIIITATGLKVQLVGGATVSVDGTAISLGNKFIWRGTMIQDIPNAFVITGYTDASWTPGADATSRLITRLLSHMKGRGMVAATPRLAHPERLKPVPLLNLSSTYLRVATDVLPQSSSTGPWKAKSNYFVDMYYALFGNITDGLEFEKAVA